MASPKKKSRKTDDGFETDLLANSEAVESGEDRGETENVPTTQSAGGRFNVEHAGPVVSNPSEIGNPYVGQEAQDVEIRPAVLGPPAYASPDPNSLVGRLVPVEQHARALAGELDEDYGRDVKEVSSHPLYAGGPGTPDGADYGEGGNLSTDASGDRFAATDAEGDKAGSYDSMTKADLLELSAAREIEGRSDMNKAELVEANVAYDEANGS